MAAFETNDANTAGLEGLPATTGTIGTAEAGFWNARGQYLAKFACIYIAFSPQSAAAPQLYIP